MSQQASGVAWIPEGMHTITPHIVVGDASDAARWYSTAFGAEERNRITLPGGKAMTVELWFADSAVMVASEFPDMGIVSPLTLGGTATVLQIYTDDVDSLWKRALDAGAEVRHPLSEMFWGDRHGQITDPYGHRWNLAQRVRDVEPDDIARAAAEAFGGNHSKHHPTAPLASRDGRGRHDSPHGAQAGGGVGGPGDR